MLAPNTNPNAIVIKGTYIANTSANNEKNKQRDKNNINSSFGMISDLARLMFRSKMRSIFDSLRRALPSVRALARPLRAKISMGRAATLTFGELARSRIDNATLVNPLK